MKTVYLSALTLLIITQLAIPYRMIRSHERILSEGALFRFQTRPIDPADPFQGRYVRLRYKSSSIKCKAEEIEGLRRKDPVYALVIENDAGFAELTGWSRKKPTEGTYFKTRYRYVDTTWHKESSTRTTNGIRVDISFDRFYMDEAKAPRAETLAFESTRNSNCWANVRILNGNALIEDVFAEGKSLRELAAKKDE
ncbi:GDYXXLXY domain-containing protein [Pontiellaceae bacterium B12227]|nr:GDYXXLXY domain-containing protein [Pontiellaceae bacterium B12227]